MPAGTACAISAFCSSLRCASGRGAMRVPAAGAWAATAAIDASTAAAAMGNTLVRMAMAPVWLSDSPPAIRWRPMRPVVCTAAPEAQRNGIAPPKVSEETGFRPAWQYVGAVQTRLKGSQYVPQCGEAATMKAIMPIFTAAYGLVSLLFGVAA